MRTKQKSLPNHQSQLSFDFSSAVQTFFKLCSLENIIETLPKLFPEQQEDVLFAENRFEHSKGILFTNGTGTGKTYTALGIIKRFKLQNKNNVLIVVPTDKKAKDWILEANVLELSIRQLESINCAYEGITVTTYSNFYQNEAINL